MFKKDQQYFRFCAYGFLKNLRFFEPFLILFFRDQGLSYTEIGLLYALREIAKNLLEIPAGVFADTAGRKKSMVSSFIAYLISFSVFFFAGSFWSFLPAIILFAIGDAFRTGTHKAMILTYLKIQHWESHKVDYYGHTRSWSQIGSGISALVAGLVVFLSGQYRIAFLVSMFPYLVNLVNLATYPKKLDQPENNTKNQPLRLQLKSTVQDFWISIRNPMVLKAMLGLSSYTGLYKALKDYIQPLIQALAISIPLAWIGNEQQKESVLVGIIYFVLFISTSQISRRSGTWMRKQKNTQTAMIITLSVGAVAGIASGVLLQLNFQLLAVILFGFIFMVENLRKPIGIGQIADELDEKVLASALSAESQAETIFAALLAFILGILTDLTSLGIGLAITSALVLLIIPYLRKINKISRDT